LKHPPVVDPEALLGELKRAGVEFIVVGGTAAILHAAPVTTQDLDIVHLANRNLRPTAEMLMGRGQINLSTSLGPLDSLCELGEGEGYDELLPNTVELGDDQLTLRVLDLPTLIEVKSRTGRAKDRAVLPILIATLEEQRKRSESS
jgi:hypothetical protein